MPGVKWKFERSLLNMRETHWTRSRRPHRTFFTCCENDRSLYFASVPQMPGMRTNDAILQKIKPFPFAEFAYKTKFASLFFANVDDFMAFDWRPEAQWDGLWLDYTGPPSVERLAIISKFYQHHINGILVVTALKARWDSQTSRAITEAGGYTPWLQHHLPGTALHSIEYNDTSPMVQFAIRKPVILPFSSFRKQGVLGFWQWQMWT
jgi:hypothetical protein